MVKNKEERDKQMGKEKKRVDALAATGPTVKKERWNVDVLGGDYMLKVS